MTCSVSHFGLSVADLDVAERFYTHVFGFQRTIDVPATRDYNKLVRRGDANLLKIRMISKGDTSIELLQFDPPAPAPERPSIYQIGRLAHVAINVDSVKDYAARIVAAGGQVFEETRTVNDHGEFLFCTDPDGSWIELVALVRPVSEMRDS